MKLQLLGKILEGSPFPQITLRRDYMRQENVTYTKRTVQAGDQVFDIITTENFAEGDICYCNEKGDVGYDPFSILQSMAANGDDDQLQNMINEILGLDNENVGQVNEEGGASPDSEEVQEVNENAGQVNEAVEQNILS